MAPEMIEMSGNISTSCDIWSVGCTIIELLTGNPPYSDLLQYPALFRIVQDEHPPLPDGISDNCRDILMKCFDKEPSSRIDATKLLKHPWLRGNNNEVIEYYTNTNEFPETVNNTIRLYVDSNVDKMYLTGPQGEKIGFLSNEELIKIFKEQGNLQQSQKIEEINRNESVVRQGTNEILLYENLPIHSINSAHSVENKYNIPNLNLYGKESTLTNEELFMRTKSNFGTICEEGSFVSVDNENQNNILLIDSLRQLRFKKKEKEIDRMSRFHFKYFLKYF